MSRAGLVRTLPSLDRPLPALGLAGASVGLAVLLAWMTPLAWMVSLAGVIGAIALVHAARRLGAETLWVGAIAVSLLAGELSSVSVGGQNGRLLWADAVLAIAAVWFVARSRARLEIPAAPFLLWLVPFVAWSALGLLMAGDVLTGIAELKEWVAALAVGAAAACAARDRARAHALLVILAVTGTLIALHMLWVLTQSPYGPVLAVLLKRIDLPWGRSNYLAGLLIVTFPITLGCLGLASTWRTRLPTLAMLCIQAAGVGITASKGAMLAMVLALFGAFVGRGRASRVGLATIAVVLLAGTALYVVGPLQKALAYRMQASALSYSVSERMDLYHLALDEFAGSPLWGIGLNNFSVVANRLRGVDTVPHNFELGYLAEVGLLGLLLACIWVGVLGRSVWQLRQRAHDGRARVLALGVFAAFLAMAIHNQFESTIYGQQFKVILMIMAAAAWRLAYGASSPFDRCNEHEPAKTGIAKRNSHGKGIAILN